MDKLINNFLHNILLPIQQSLKAHIELSRNQSLHIQPKVLKDISKRLDGLRNELLVLMDKEECKNVSETTTMVTKEYCGCTGDSTGCNKNIEGSSNTGS